MMTNDHDTFFLPIHTYGICPKNYCFNDGTCTHVSFWVRHCWCPIQLTDFFVLLIKAIRQHRAPHPYRFDSVTVSSRVFLRVVWCLRCTTLRAVPDQLPRGPRLVGTVGYLLWYVSHKQHGLMAYVYIHQKISESNIKGAKKFKSEYFNRSSNIRTSFNIPNLGELQLGLYIKMFIVKLKYRLVLKVIFRPRMWHFLWETNTFDVAVDSIWHLFCTSKLDVWSVLETYLGGYHSYFGLVVDPSNVWIWPDFSWCPVENEYLSCN